MKHSKGFRVGLFPKLMVAFLAVIITGAILTTWLVRRATRAEFQLYTAEIGRGQAEMLSALLAGYYLDNGSWQGIQVFLATPAESSDLPGQGGGNQMMGEMMGRGRGRGPNSTSGMMAGMNIWQMMGNQILLADNSGLVVADSAGELLGLQLNEEDLSAGVPVTVDGQPVGTVLATAGCQSPEQNEEFLRQVGQAILTAVLIASAIALIFGGLIAWGIVRPLRQLTGAAQAIADGELEQQVEVASNDEIGDLALAFNQMSARLTRSEGLRRQLTADIAHELRTPLTVIQGNIEALQDGIFPLTKQALDPIYDKTILLRRLVEDLRQLTSAETGQLALDKQTIDLAALATKTADSFRAVSEDKAITLSVTKVEDVPSVSADPQRIEQVMVNFISNALRHTPEGGEISVSVSRQGQAIRLAVKDSGPGIPAEALPNVFERFYRVDQGRAREADGGGSGLGLAVAHSIIQSHGGRIGVESKAGQGATFWFTLPID